jgi:RecA-family ATPase
MDIIEQARRYLDKMPPAVSGNGGHDQTFRVACVLTQGFGLNPAEAYPLMQEYSARCVPPWTERDITHKLTDADRTVDPKGRGYLLKKGIRHRYSGPNGGTLNGSRTISGVSTPVTTHQSSPQLKPEARRYALTNPGEVPKPLQNGTTELIRLAFQKGEGIRIAIARTNEEGKEVPKDAGVVLSREEWLTKLESVGGDPNKFMRTAEKNGIFISINPLKIGGSRDADVTAFRHCLLEFDQISVQEQWNLIQQSRIPATAVISSGGRSIHAWVKVDAKDRAEYDQRVKLLYAHFAEYRPDEKNKNPSRFSRLPNCVRFDKRQELLALNLGAESFSEWQMEQEMDDLGQEIRIGDLCKFEPEKDNQSVLGNRWLCRGGSCLIVGQSGIGKSSIEMQLALLWALERPAFGICPAKPLKSLIIQAENDVGDIAEMFQGVWLGMEIGDQPELLRQAHDNIIFRKINSHTGHEFLKVLRRLIDIHKPDLVWLDPVLAYIGDDISKQSVCSAFFRNGLNPIADATGVIWMILHHTGKPPKDPKSKQGWNLGDYSYEGMGSSDLTNWARAICVLHRFDDNLFELKLAKRGKRAGARDTKGSATTSVWLSHSDKGICWKQVEEPSKEKVEEVKSKFKVGHRKPLDFDFDAFLESIKGEYFSLNQLAERVEKFSKVSTRTAWRNVIPELKKRMRVDPESEKWTA